MRLATSKAGHDKDAVYVIVKEDAAYYYVADGKAKGLTSLKKKNKKHLQVIKQIPREAELTDLAKKFDEGKLTEDHEIKRMLTIYKKCRRDEDV
ncbi:MAG: hypothetical protein MJ105_06060 [Lachnospiraceae bacterium]|nr:hypothetical protein [Lachnospiraceae bacterium]